MVCLWACSSVWLERSADNRKVESSNLSRPTYHSLRPLVVLTFLNSFTPSAEFVDNLPHGDVESSTGG